MFSVCAEEYLEEGDLIGDIDQDCDLEYDNFQEPSLEHLKSKPNILCKTSRESNAQLQNLNEENEEDLSRKRKRSRANKDGYLKPLHDQEVTENFIEEIAQRNCLWDITIPVEQRGPKQNTDAWQSVARSLGGKQDII